MKAFDHEGFEREVNMKRAKGIPVGRIASDIGITRQTLANVLDGKLPSLRTLMKLQAHFRRAFLKEVDE